MRMIGMRFVPPAPEKLRTGRKSLKQNWVKPQPEVAKTRRNPMSMNHNSATAVLAVSAVGLLSSGCDDSGFLAPPGDPHNAVAVAALDPESPER